MQFLTRLFRKKPVGSLPRITPIDPRLVTSDQRLLLIKWLNDPTTQYALGLLESAKPSVFPVLRERIDVDRYLAERRLLQLQGWESCRNTLLGLRYTPEEIKQLVKETYPEED